MVYRHQAQCALCVYVSRASTKKGCAEQPGAPCEAEAWASGQQRTGPEHEVRTHSGGAFVCGSWGTTSDISGVYHVPGSSCAQMEPFYQALREGKLCLPVCTPSAWHRLRGPCSSAEWVGPVAISHVRCPQDFFAHGSEAICTATVSAIYLLGGR